MECVACGRKVSSSTRYCNECGAFQPEYEMNQEKKKKQSKWLKRFQ